MSARAKTTSVSLDPDVTAYLEDLGKKADRSRSWLINAIVRSHAQQDRDEQLRMLLLPHEVTPLPVKQPRRKA
jgi:metal-responsive CopG/Arc/MetJ family transcriptional regulator